MWKTCFIGICPGGTSDISSDIKHLGRLEFLRLMINMLRPRQNGRHFADAVFNCIFLNENVWISLMILLKFVPNVPINNIPVLPGSDNYLKPIMVNILTHICVTWPQWVNPLRAELFCGRIHMCLHVIHIELSYCERCSSRKLFSRRTRTSPSHVGSRYPVD